MECVSVKGNLSIEIQLCDCPGTLLHIAYKFSTWIWVFLIVLPQFEEKWIAFVWEPPYLF